MKTYGMYEFGLGKSLDLVLRAGEATKTSTLEEYIKTIDTNLNNHSRLEPLYIFDRTIWDQERRKFQKNHFKGQRIPFFKFAKSKIDYNGQILALGNTGTGATFHAHGESWLFLVAGRKRWYATNNSFM